MRGSRRERAEQGMSLVEVMIAMGVMGVLFLGVSQLSTMTAKNVKSAAMSTDWVNYMANVRMIMSKGDGTECTKIFEGAPAPTTKRNDKISLGEVAKDPTAFIPINKLELGGVVYLEKGKVTNGFKVETMGLTLAPGADPEPLPFLKEPEFPGFKDGPYLRGRVRLEIAAFKVIGKETATGGQIIATGGNSVSSVKEDAVTFRVIYGTAGGTAVVKQCHSLEDKAAETCDMLGGVYNEKVEGRYKCVLNDVFFAGGSAAVSDPKDAAPAGEKIQLKPGNPDVTKSQGVKSNADFSIGVGNDGKSDYVWFNSGQSQYNGYRWTNSSGGSVLMSLYGESYVPDPDSKAPAYSLDSPGLTVNASVRFKQFFGMGTPTMKPGPPPPKDAGPSFPTEVVDDIKTQVNNAGIRVSLNGKVDLNGDVRVNGTPPFNLANCHWRGANNASLEEYAKCEPGETIVSGGCSCGLWGGLHDKDRGEISVSRPDGGNQWYCQCQDNSNGGHTHATAFCCK